MELLIIWCKMCNWSFITMLYQIFICCSFTCLGLHGGYRTEACCFHICRSRSASVGHIDKQKLLEIARKNAMNLLKQGVLPSTVVTQDKMVAIKAGGKSVAELTGTVLSQFDSNDILLWILSSRVRLSYSAWPWRVEVLCFPERSVTVCQPVLPWAKTSEWHNSTYSSPSSSS